ncbi:MAG: LAGLIDADG family homing endonuclease [archaeon]
MILDKLGNSLKDTLSKIARSMFVDEKVINELVKDIQRALLQADVNVELVFELTKRIKERALKEDTKIISKKEHLVKIVYEELVNFLGDEKEEIQVIQKKPFKIMMIGVYGSGKCVHPDTQILLSNGSLINAKHLYDEYSNKAQISHLEDGEIIDLDNHNLYVPSFNPNTFKVENKKVTHLWKLDGKELLQVYLDNGNDFSVKVTPEHPFFVLRKGNFCKIRADELNEDDFVAIPKNCNISIKKNIDLYNPLKKLNLDVYLNPNDSKKIILTKYKTIKEAWFDLKDKRNYCKFTLEINKEGRIPISILDDFNFPYFKLKYLNAKKPIYFPRYITSELTEFIGYVIGDGYIHKRGIDISNEDPEIIDRVKELSLLLFGINANIKKDDRTRNLFKIQIASKTLVFLFEKLFNLKAGKKGKSIRVPNQILSSPEDCIISFLRAYFDCDSYPSLNIRNIELVSESKPLIVDVHHLLLRFGIISTISKKLINKIPYWRLYIQARYAEKYANKIGFRILKKSKKISEYNLIGIRQGCGKSDMIPVGNLLYDVRNSFGHSLGQISRNIFSYSIYEKTGFISLNKLSSFYNFICENKKGRMLNILANAKNIKYLKENYSNPIINAIIPSFIKSELLDNSSEGLVLTEKGNCFLNKYANYNKEEKLNFIKNLIESDVCWVRVNKINPIEKPDFVYDLTVEDNHSFIADGFIVHNTTTISKLSNYYKKRGYKIATLGLDVHRAAAFDQLELLSEKVGVKCFIDRKEKNPVKIYRKFEEEFKNYDILIVDTAGRDSLNYELIKEISDLNNTIEPDEKLLVVSAEIGQAARELAEGFKKSCGITGVIVSKLDGTAKGGGALSACSVSGAKIKFIGIGEKIDDLEVFNPKGFVSRLLGMGDLEALLEKAQDAFKEEDAKDISKKLMEGDFNLIDLYDQMQAMNKMGPLSKVMEMVPGFGQIKLPKDMLKVQEGKLKKWKFILDSCSKNELEHPEIIDGARAERIARGSGVDINEVRELLKQYKQSKKLMRMMKGKDPEKMMKKFGNIKLK